MKHFKRLSALILTFFLTVSVLTPSFAAAGNGTDVWDGSIATAFSGGTGTLENPYLISTGSQLAYMAQQVNAGNSTSNPYRSAVYKVTADIDLNSIEWTPIGNGNNYFCGTLIGGGHTIKNLKISGNANNVGLFGNIANAKICDMTISDSSISSSGYHVGAFVGTAGASPGTALCNLHVVNTAISGKYAVGGIMGFANEGSYNTMTLCCSSIQGGSVSGSQYAVGGLIGWVYDAVVKINRSWCEADSITSGTYGGAGGLVGIAADLTRSTKSQVNITDGYNTADVKVGTPAGSTSYYNAAGGIVGYSKTAGSTVERCYNTGSITAGRSTGTSTKSYAAGICGYSVGGTYTKCFNAGSAATTNASATAAYKPTLSGIRVNSGTVTDCYYKSDCFTSDKRYFTLSTSGTEIVDKSAIIAKMNNDSAFTGTGFWKMSEDEYPVLAGCVDADGTCTCGCGCYCTPSTPEEPEVKTFTVTYVYNGEEKSVVEVTEGKTIQAAGEEICYDGLYDKEEYVKVTGWTDGNTDGNNIYAIGSEITPESDMTLTACTVPVTELCDGDTEDVIGYITPEDDLTKVAYGLNYDSGSPMSIIEVEETYVIDGIWKTVSVQNLDEPDAADIRYIFAGWFKTARTDSENYKNADWDDENSVDPATLSEGENRPKRIYAYWMLGDYQKTTIGYVSTGNVASRLYTISTVPYDLFRNYGFILSTNVPAGTKDAPEEMVIGGTIGGKAVGKIEKTSIYTSFRDSKVYTSAHKANQFNGGYAGYISYGSVSNLSLTYADKTPVTVSARAYYTTKDGTLVYCDLSQTTLQANTVDKGLNN